MKSYHGLVLIGLISIQFVSARLENVNIKHGKVKLLSMKEMRFCYISFVTVDGEKYLIKQKKPLNKLLGVVRDALTAHIAESFGIGMAHRVDIIPAGKEFPGKFRADWPATIHTIAPGKMIKAQEGAYYEMKIKQANIGFRRDMLPWMIKHETLVKVVALDTFLCNHDRHRGNLFYNVKTDSFCAIDMDSAWKYNLCALACNNFTEMLNDKKLQLSTKEVKALTLYRDYIQFLIDNHQPEDTIKMYDYFAEKAGFVEGSDLYTQKFAEGLAYNKTMIMRSYQDAKKLVTIVDQLIKKHKKL
ncbi:MAG TPA: hypothetical protein VLB80_04440 [Candidatus Babeliales bacterium]|nr:hypothetical protein [Candidatus Babeliales bacterium]